MGVGFTEVVRAALLVHDALTALGLESYPMTTGGDGMHVRVPVARSHTHADTRAFAELVGSALVRVSDGLVTMERSRARRHGVFLDAKMNGHGQQLVAPYSVRPLPGAPVATPLRWDELDDSLEPTAFPPAAVLDRIGRHGDLYAPLLHGRQRLDHAVEGST